ncbi:hypothetical protein KAZ82_00050, partial [Candidatus Babeliales bacterium]|nr:hypothetical protein [Candidatus Babeliales bacterium]
MIKKYILVAIFGVNIVYANEGNQTFSLKQVLASYQKALQQLILAHDQLYPKQQLQVDNDRLVMQTYQKLLNPCVTWICGYAQIVSSQLVRGIDVEADLNHLFHIYMEYEHEVKRIVSLFPDASQKDFMDVFYDAVASRVVQVGFDIVQKSSYQYKFDQKALQTVDQAYQLAWHAQTNNMKILGCTTKSDFQQKISQNIQILFSAAINHYQSLLQQGMIDNESLQSTYKILEWCTHVLYEVYKNNGNVQNAAIEQSLLQNFASQQQAYQQGLLQQQQADSKIQQTQNLITLNYAQATTVLNDVTASLKAFSVAQKLYQNAEQNFNSSGNVVGKSSVAVQLAILNEYDILFRFVQKLWALFLIDQSSQNVISFPSLAAFVQGNAAGQVSNAVQALSNLSGMLSNQYVTENNMIALTGTTQNLLITSIFDDMQNFAQKNCTHHGMVAKDFLFNVPLLLHAQQVV